MKAKIEDLKWCMTCRYFGFRSEYQEEVDMDFSYLECWYPKSRAENDGDRVFAEKMPREVLFYFAEAHKFMRRNTINCPAWKSEWELP